MIDSSDRNYVILLAVAIALTVTLFSTVQQTGGVYPYGIVVVFLSLSVIFILGATGRVPFVSALVAVCVVSVSYRVLILSIPDGVLIPDPAWYQIQTQLVSEAGYTDVIQSSFYRQAPIFILFLTIVTNTVGISPELSFTVFSATIGLIFPMFGAVFVRWAMRENADFGALATATIISVSWHSVYFSYYTIAQSFAVAVLLVVTFLILRNNDRGSDRRYLYTFLGISLVLPFIHKLSVFYAGVILIAVGVVAVNKNVRAQTTIPVILIGILFIAQFVMLTDGGVARILGRIRPAILALIYGSTAPAPPTPSHAFNPVQTSTLVRVWNNLNLIGLSLFSGVSWLYVAKERWTEFRYQILLSISACLVALAGLALVMGSSLTPVRFFYLAEVAMVLITAVGAATFVFKTGERYRYLSIIAVLILISTQLAVIGAVPDDSRTADRFLSSSERSGLEYSEYTTDSIHTDYINRHAGKSGLVVYNDYLLNGDLPNNETEVIAYRPNQEIYRSTSYYGDWKRTWDPGERLDKVCQRIFSNDGVVYYRCST